MSDLRINSFNIFNLYVQLKFLSHNKQHTWRCILESESSRIESSLNQEAVGRGKPMKGTWMLKSSPARTVMSRTPPKSMHGLLGCSSTKIPALGLLGSLLPMSFTAITRNWYSSPSFNPVTCVRIRTCHINNSDINHINGRFEVFIAEP